MSDYHPGQPHKDILQRYASCTLCPRHCHVNRLAGETGYCGQTAQLRAARAALHMWEEPCISGAAGSGTVFFSGCSLRCIY
ncbi:MAG: radical SAM protein, partial [Acetatifactor sp.]|nr:radical SAM protein [Acetatifactor sp.]